MVKFLWPTQYKEKTESEQYKIDPGLVYMLGVTFFFKIYVKYQTKHIVGTFECESLNAIWLTLL